MPQRLHLVFGGELVDPQRTEFRDAGEIEIAGAGAHATVDSAHVRYPIARFDRLIEGASATAPAENPG